MKRGQISGIFMHIPDDDRLARIQRRAAKPLTNRETWIRRRLGTGFCENDKLVLDDLVNADPSIIPRGANHFYKLAHSLSGAPSGQCERPDLLQLFARGLLHSREGNLAQKKPRASTIFNFLQTRPARE